MNKTLTMKIKVMEKLGTIGINTDKQLKELNILDLLDDDSFSREHLKIVKALQEAVSSGKVYTYLMTTEGEQGDYTSS